MKVIHITWIVISVIVIYYMEKSRERSIIVNIIIIQDKIVYLY